MTTVACIAGYFNYSLLCVVSLNEAMKAAHISLFPWRHQQSANTAIVVLLYALLMGLYREKVAKLQYCLLDLGLVHTSHNSTIFNKMAACLTLNYPCKKQLCDDHIASVGWVLQVEDCDKCQISR
jgi:hypothetical protein